jgi:hypothetical protein
MAVGGRDVCQADQVGGDTWLNSSLLAQLDGPPQQLPGGPEPIGGELGHAQVPKRVGEGQQVAGLGRELDRTLERHDGRGAVIFNDLPVAADPEPRLALASPIVQRPVSAGYSNATRALSRSSVAITILTPPNVV